MIFSLLRSLCITGLAGTLVPTLLMGCMMLVLFAFGYVPGLGDLSNTVQLQLMHFLQVFGSGNPFQGVGVMAVVSGSVAMLFDTYNLLASSKPAR